MIFCNPSFHLYCARLPDNQECHELRYKRLRKGLKDSTKIPADNQHHVSSSSTEVKYAGEASSTSHGAGIANNAMLLGHTSTEQQQLQQRVTARGASSLQQRLAELSQSLSTSIDTQSAAAVNTDLAALLSAISAAVNRPTH